MNIRLFLTWIFFLYNWLTVIGDIFSNTDNLVLLGVNLKSMICGKPFEREGGDVKTVDIARREFNGQQPAAEINDRRGLRELLIQLTQNLKGGRT